MTITIGRVSITQNLSELEFDGDRLDVAGWFFGTDLNHAKVIREQLLGLDANEDEPDIPVVYSYDSKIDGYYTVGSVNVSQIIGVSYERFKFQYAIQLERVQGGFALPLVEVAAAVSLRTNGVSVTPGNASTVGVPYAASFRAARFSDGTIGSVASNSPNFHVTATGDVINAQYFPGISPSLMSVTSATLPADYYDGAATIEQSISGTWYPVVGDQIGYIVGNLLRVGNGLVRSTFHTDGVITSEVFDGTVWESSTSFSLISNTAGTPLTWIAEGGWKIVRNDPAACTIRTSAQFDVASGNNLPASVILHVERGKMLAEIFADNMFYDLDNSGTLAYTLQLRANTVTAATALTGGIRQTSNNAQGHRWIMMCPSAVTNDLVNGRITIAVQSAPLIAQFGLGWERDGSASTGPRVAATVAAHYFGVSGLRQRVVSR